MYLASLFFFSQATQDVCLSSFITFFISSEMEREGGCVEMGVVIRREKKVYSFDLSLKPIERAPTPASCSVNCKAGS